MDNFGQHLKRARKKKGLSQKALADLVNLPQSHLSRIERGLVDVRLSNYVELSRVLEMEPLLIPRPFVGFVRALLEGKEQTPAYQLDGDDEYT